MAVFITGAGIAPSLGTRLGDLEIGTIVHIKENGTYQDYLVVNQGLPSSMYDSSCNGTWLLRNAIYNNQVWDSSINDYENSNVQSYLNGIFLSVFDDDIQTSIKTAKIPYQYGDGENGYVKTGSNGLSCKIFLLSGYEVGFRQNDDRYFPIDGARLAYFDAGTSTDANNKRIAKLNGSSSLWWLRSPYTANTVFTWIVFNDGDSNPFNCGRDYGVRPALIMPSDLLVDDNNNILV